MNTNWSFRLSRILLNLAAYIVHIPNDIYLTVWGTVVGLLDSFFRRYIVEVGAIGSQCHFSARSFRFQRHGNQASIASELNSVIIIMNAVLKVQNFSSFKVIESALEWMN